MEMTPTEIRDILYSAKLDLYYKLPYKVMSEFPRRPPENKSEQAKFYMYFRASIIAIITIYVFMHFSGESSAQYNIRMITFILIGYEIAYYNLRVDTLKSIYERDLTDYINAAQSYVKVKFPELV